MMSSDWSRLGKTICDVSVKLKPRVFPLFRSERMLTIRSVHQGVTAKLLAPSEHALDVYQALYPLYDKRFPLLSKIVSSHRPESTLIDVGANIGDGVSLCRLAGCTSKIIAVEPSEKFFGYLRRNAANNQPLFDKVQCINAFIGQKTDNLVLLERKGTAEPVDRGLSVSANSSGHNSSRSSIPTLSLAELNAADVSLVKTDTDGYDAEVLSANLGWLLKHQPIIWAEAEVKTIKSLSKWITLIDQVDCRVYSHAMAFDNYGYAVAGGNLSEMKPLITSILQYIHGHVATPSEKLGPTTVFYLDVALFPKTDLDIYDEFHSQLVELARNGAMDSSALSARNGAKPTSASL
jgi:FkbM family methyltransferase